ncbi:hypothetical protein T484DRAFT_1645047 [Baffinella frigidus]|nr:hypothetical protein T484DRAFT_1645047 [Cryptophyta sp. CCMP2293]
MDLNKATLGVVGGGQLGRMMAYPAHRLGVKLVCLDAAGPTAPCAKISGHVVHGGLKDPEKTKELRRTTHKQTCRVHEQDKFAQKEHFTAKGIPGAPYMKTDSVAELLAAGEKMGYPMMLKARGNSYDGKGNYVVKTPADAPLAFETLSKTSDRGCYAEGWAEFTMELAVMVVRGTNEILAYPVVETEQRDSICHITVCPARISEEARAMTEKFALEAVSSLGGRGPPPHPSFIPPTMYSFLPPPSPAPPSVASQRRRVP